MEPGTDPTQPNQGAQVTLATNLPANSKDEPTEQAPLRTPLLPTMQCQLGKDVGLPGVNMASS